MATDTPEQKRARIFVRIGDRDLETAEALASAAPHLYESVGFSCQQAVEKYTKALLIAANLPAPFTHNLVVLLRPLSQANVVQISPPDLAAAATLQDFAVEWRYDTDTAPGYTASELLIMAHQLRAKLRPLALEFLT